MEASQIFDADIQVPFQTEREASIVAKSLQIDLKYETNRMKEGITKNVEHDQNKLNIKFETGSLKTLRQSINSMLESVSLLIDTIDNFDLIEKEKTKAPSVGGDHHGRQ